MTQFLHRSITRWLAAVFVIAAILFLNCSAISLAAPQDNAGPDVKAETEKKGADAGKPAKRAGVWDLVVASGFIGYAIIAISVAATALALEQAIVIRRGALMPAGLAHELHSLITEEDFTQAEQLCKLRPSYLSFVVHSGLQEVRSGYDAVEKAMEDASQEQAARLYRKVEYLAVIANISPMLGLLGTVWGILLAFKQVAETQGAAVAADLADGVYLALVTTVLGLVVAIPTLAVYALLRTRIEQFASEVNLLAEQIFNNYRRNRSTRAMGQMIDTM